MMHSLSYKKSFSLTAFTFCVCYLQELRKQMESNRPKLAQVKQVGDQLKHDPRANDVLYIERIVSNLDTNWNLLEDGLAERYV